MDSWFGVVRWCDADIGALLAENGLTPTKERIAAIRAVCENDHHFTDTMIVAGWEAIEDAAREAGILK